MKKRLLALVAAYCASAAWPALSLAASFGVNFQTDRGGYGPASVSAETPASAFGVAGADWYEPGSVQIGSTMFATGGGNINIAWSSYPLVAPGIAYGWTHANQGGIPSPPGDPASGEDAVLSAYLFASGPGEYDAVPDGAPIVVTLSNLGSVADLAAGYSVRLLASSEWTVDMFTPATVEDNSAHSEVVNFANFAEHPLWWTGPPWESTGAMGTSGAIFTGDTLTITLAGRNESGTAGNGDYVRTALAGVVVDFVAVPEPGEWVLSMTGILGCVIVGCSRRPKRKVALRELS